MGFAVPSGDSGGQGQLPQLLTLHPATRGAVREMRIRDFPFMIQRLILPVRALTQSTHIDMCAHSHIDTHTIHGTASRVAG